MFFISPLLKYFFSIKYIRLRENQSQYTASTRNISFVHYQHNFKVSSLFNAIKHAAKDPVFVRRRGRSRRWRSKRNRGDGISAVAVGSVRGRHGQQKLCRGLRLRRQRRASVITRRRGAGWRQSGAAVRGLADVGRARRLCAVRGIQAGPVGLRRRVVPVGGTVAPVRPDRPTRADDRTQGDGRRAVRQCVQDVRGRARPRVPVRVPTTHRSAARPDAILLPSRLQQQSTTVGRPQIRPRGQVETNEKMLK